MKRSIQSILVIVGIVVIGNLGLSLLAQLLGAEVIYTCTNEKSVGISWESDEAGLEAYANNSPSQRTTLTFVTRGGRASFRRKNGHEIKQRKLKKVAPMSWLEERALAMWTLVPGEGEVPTLLFLAATQHAFGLTSNVAAFKCEVTKPPSRKSD